MILTNQWGLLALLSIPLILGLHFFRSHRQTREIGGLHLWQFAAIRQPIGSRWTRLLRSWSLLFQLLAATLLSLLIAGIDFPRRESALHYTILVDDSVSMTAREDGTPADRTRAALRDWAGSEARFTLVAAGTRAQVIAGPYADRPELLRQLDAWQPRAASCDLPQAVQLAARFVTGEEKMLFVTDQPEQAREYDNLLAVLGVGDPLSNQAVVFADRVRVNPDRDRVFVTLQTFGSESATRGVRVRAGSQPIDVSIPRRQLRPGESDSFSFDIDLLEVPIEITLAPDALAVDNRVVLAPVPVRNIRVYAEAMEPLSRFLTRSVEATPFAFVEPDPEHADLVFCRLPAFPPARSSDESAAAPGASSGPVAEKVARETPFPQPLLDQYAAAALICAVPGDENAGVAGVAQGLDVVADSESPITLGLPLEEGILWPFVATSAPPSCAPLLTTAKTPLLFGGPVDARRATQREFYYLNILTDRTNIYQTSVFPVLIRNLIQQTRRIVPGMPRTNYRVGEQVLVSLDAAPSSGGEAVALLRNGEPYERFVGTGDVPRVLGDLDAGTYQFRGEDGQSLAVFSVNFFARAESDLTAAGRSAVDFAELEPGRITRAATDHRLFLVLATLVILLTGLSWISQDSAR